MEKVFENKYLDSLLVWKQENESLIGVIQEYHKLLKGDINFLKDIEQDEDFMDFSLITKSEINFVKMLKRLNEIINCSISNKDKIIKYDILKRICASYHDIDGIGTLRLDRIFDKANREEQYKRIYNMIQQYLRIIEQLQNKFKEGITQEKEFLDKYHIL